VVFFNVIFMVTNTLGVSLGFWVGLFYVLICILCCGSLIWVCLCSLYLHIFLCLFVMLWVCVIFGLCVFVCVCVSELAPLAYFIVLFSYYILFHSI
jgi:hypothetical protein